MPGIKDNAAGKAVILHPDFANRLNAVANANPNVPPVNYGRLGWFAEEFAKRGEDVSKEMVRKYFAGENKPRQKRMSILAEILGVDEAWLTLGKSAEVQTKRNMLRNAQVSGVVNVVAGLIQMHGGSPAFPEDGDTRAAQDNIDLYAIIRGAQYAFTVTLAEEEGAGFVFRLPPAGAGQNTIVLGVIQKTPLCFDILELDAEGLEKVAKRGKASVEIAVDRDFRSAGYAWRRIETFAKRL